MPARNRLANINLTAPGGKKIEVRKRWPDGTEFRRFFPNRTVAKATQAQIDAAIALGPWRELRRDLARGKAVAPTRRPEETFGGFSTRFVEEYVKPRLKSAERYELALRHLKRRLGNIKLTEFSRSDMHGYIQARRKDHACRHTKTGIVALPRRISKATVNRELACAKSLFSFAVEVQVIQPNAHPLLRFPSLAEDEKATRPVSPEDVEALIDFMAALRMKGYIAVLAETGIRRGEGMALTWKNVSLRYRLLKVEKTKNHRARTIPLSDRAIKWLTRIPRHIRSPFVFADRKGRPLVNPDKTFRQATASLKLEGVGLHDLRRYRAVQWYRNGVHARTIQEMLGHADLNTTLRYLKDVDTAVEEVRSAQKREAAVGEKRVMPEIVGALG